MKVYLQHIKIYNILKFVFKLSQIYKIKVVIKDQKQMIKNLDKQD